MADFKKLLKHALSDAEINNFFDGMINIMKYSELSKYKDLNNVLGKYGRCIILFENGEIDNGHWCLLHLVQLKNKKKYVEFFDSYGSIPDTEFDWIPKSFQNLSMQKRGTLLKLLINQELPVHYSQYRLQKLGKLDGVPVNTCGKWCCLRAKYNNISEKEFADEMRSGEMNDITTDELCCLLYQDLEN